MSQGSFSVVIDKGLFDGACVLTCAVWVAVGCYKVCHRRQVVERMREHRIPWSPGAFWASVLAEFGGALLIGAQINVTAGCALWIIFLIVATPVYHGRIFPARRIDYAQFVQLFKNLSIAGGLVALIAIDSGRVLALPAASLSGAPAYVPTGLSARRAIASPAAE